MKPLLAACLLLASCQSKERPTFRDYLDLWFVVPENPFKPHDTHPDQDDY